MMGRLGLREKWESLRKSANFHNVLVYLAFVVVVTLFWFMMALNDSVQKSYDVRININGVPDSVTFISVPPERMHVTVRDKGTSLLRRGTPSININFREFADDGIFRFSKADLNAALKTTFGNSAVISSVSLDSLRLAYTSLKGKRVPLRVLADVSAASGNVIAGAPFSEQKAVLVFSTRDVLDTVMSVQTVRIVRRNLKETAEVEAKIVPIPGARVEPASVKITIPVEPLVSEESTVTVVARNVPKDISLLLFPSKVNVRYFVPMSHFGDEDPGIEVWVDYDDTSLVGTKKLPIRIGNHPAKVKNITLMTDSLEYTIVKN